MQYRLDKVAEAGLKIWITELTVSENDANKKAVALENLMTLFFSHPAVEGIMLWGFWDGAIHNAPAKLFEGPNLTVNTCILLENILQIEQPYLYELLKLVSLQNLHVMI